MAAWLVVLVGEVLAGFFSCHKAAGRPYLAMMLPGTMTGAPCYCAMVILDTRAFMTVTARM